MKLPVGLFGLWLMGCGTATPVPDWTPAQAQAPPKKQSSPQLAELEKRSLPVKTPPTPPRRQALIIGQAPAANARPEVVPRSEPGPAYPTYRPHNSGSPSVALNQDSAPEPGVDFASININQFLGLNSSSSCAVVLLVDVSGSVFQRGVEVAVDAAAKVYARQSLNDRVWVVAFGSQPEMVVNGHGGALTRAQLSAALTNSRPANSGTQLAPAIELASRTLAGSSQARRVVVVSDGILQDADISIWQSGQAWNRKNISFSTVQIGDDWTGAAVLQEIASQTQGRFISSR